MAELFADITEDLDRYFQDGFVANDGFKIKTKAKDFAAEAKVKGGKTALKGKFAFKTDIEDKSIDNTITIKSSGDHTFESESDLGSIIDATSIKNTLDMNSLTNHFKNETSFFNKSIEKTTLRLDVHTQTKEPVSVTAHLGRKICPGSTVTADVSIDSGSKQITGANLGVLFTPTDYFKTFVTTSLKGSLNSKNLPWNAGTLALRQRYTANPTTVLGFDYTYNVSDRTSTSKIGLSTNVSEGLDVKTQIDHTGNIQGSAIFNLNKTWKMTLSGATTSASAAGKEQPKYGVFFDGKL
mmetsp:Transcript_6268/g.5384  ORF Transcript_6268/g.5384 Transcript_6268/m.5384 type:complete len:296 (+) Transcript_6268:23-910(+)